MDIVRMILHIWPFLHRKLLRFKQPTHKSKVLEHPSNIEFTGPIILENIENNLCIPWHPTIYDGNVTEDQIQSEIDLTR